jgi:uncharacterized membrane protein/protein-disulfide isomerase
MTSTSRWLVMALALVGLGAAGTSTYVHYRLLTEPGFTSFCDVNTTVSCTQAYLSQYGSLWGVPVAIFGVLYFALVLMIAGFVWQPTSAMRERAPAYIFMLSLPALVFVLYLAYAAFFILNAFCILCAITYVAVIGIAIVSWRATPLPLTTLPARAGGDVRTAATSPAALLLAVVLVGATVAAIKAFPREGKPAAAATIETLPPVTDVERARLEEWWKLQPKVDLPVDAGGAKVVVVKFNDYQCPPCRLTYDGYKPIFREHARDVTFVLKHFPLEGECNPAAPNGGHFAACEAAAAVNMARAKGTADKLEEWLFANQGPPQLSPAQVREAARDIGGITDFDAQYPKVLEAVRADAVLGAQVKVNSTPTFYINGRMVPQILAPQFFNALIEIELKHP